MTYEEFTERAVKAIEAYMGKNYRTTVQRVRKNNGVILAGISIFGEGSNISPTIYLEEFYRRFQKGEAFGELIKEITDCYEEHVYNANLDMSFYTDYEKVKTRLAYRLVHREKNRELLKEIPYLPYLDLAIIFFCSITSELIGSGTILVRNNHLRLWDVEKEQLFLQAEKNMPSIYPEKICTMAELLRDLDVGEQDCRGKGDGQPDCAVPMYVLTNEQKIFGAGVLLYENVLRRLSEQTESSLAILPSSVHEVIAVPVEKRKEAEAMEEMVREINATQVEPEEVLSDQVYFYDRLENRLVIASEPL